MTHQQRVLSRVQSFSPFKCSSKPDAAGCCVVSAVEPASPAGVAGVACGDWLTHYEGTSPIGFDFGRLHDPHAAATWRFFRPTNQTSVELTTTGFPIGVEIGPTGESLHQLCRRGAATREDLEFVWKTGDWQNLLRASKADMKHRWLQKLWRHWFGGRPRQNCVTSLLLGAAQYELGQREAGLQRIREFHQKFLSFWTLPYHAICKYYLADDARRRNDLSTATRLLTEAFSDWPVERIRTALQQLTGENMGTPRLWKGRSVPVAYQLRELSSRTLVSLEATLDGLQPGQLLTICMLAHYRANGPYYDFVRQFRQWHEHFGDVFPQLHVITMTAEADPTRRKWLQGEEAAINAGVPIRVLLEDGGVSEVIGQSCSPYVLFVNRDRDVIFEGIPNSAEIWKLMADAEPTTPHVTSAVP